MVKRSKKLIGMATIFLLVVAGWVPLALSAPKRRVVRIGIVEDGPTQRLTHGLNEIKREILALTSREFDVRFPPSKTVVDKWNPAEVRRALDRLLADPQVDLIIAAGYLASNDACQRRKLPKPVVAPVILDVDIQNLPLKDGASGIKNLSYIDPFISFERDIKVFRDIVFFFWLLLRHGFLFSLL